MDTLESPLGEPNQQQLKAVVPIGVEISRAHRVGQVRSEAEYVPIAPPPEFAVVGRLLSNPLVYWALQAIVVANSGLQGYEAPITAAHSAGWAEPNSLLLVRGAFGAFPGLVLVVDDMRSALRPDGALQQLMARGVHIRASTRRTLVRSQAIKIIYDRTFFSELGRL